MNKKLNSLERHWAETKIKKLEMFIELVDGKHGGFFKLLASKFDNPKIELDSLKAIQGHQAVPEPTRQEDLDREYGSTTFNNCGWCEYATDSESSVRRYKYIAGGECGFLKEADIDMVPRGFSPNENNPCHMTKLFVSDASRFVEIYNEKLDALKKSLE